MSILDKLTGPSSLFNIKDPKILTGPVLIILILAMMILPLPPFLLDIFFTFNIALGLMVLLVSMLTKKPLDFAAFPSVLLFTTLLRLSLNVASARIVLMHGHNGPDAAGKVIEAFGHFLVGGNFAVGVVLFFIFVVINFMVITKGAGRIAEVGARFTLDSMPGKQMAIDADLNAGLIDADEAKSRRKQVAQESEFYASMDGASKFVRGDAMAGIIILFVTVIGGLLIGMLMHDLPFSQAIETYVLLTIGDGLVAQIPALVISIAAGVIVSRVNTDEDVGQQIVGQLFVNPRVMFMVGGIIAAFGIIPGMPTMIFLPFAAALFGIGWLMIKNQKKLEEAALLHVPQSAATKEAPEASWDDVKQTETLSFEVGHRLIPIVDERQNGALIGRISSVRKKFAQDIGFLPAIVHIKDRMDLEQNTYRISLKGVEIGCSQLYIDKFLAIESGQVSGKLEGIDFVDPAFDIPSVWIDEDQCDFAQVYGYTVVEPSVVAATFLNHLLRRHASVLLGRPEVEALLDMMRKTDKALVEDAVPKLVSISTLQRILQSLLEEQVSIRDLRTILEVIVEHAVPQQTEWYSLVAIIRIALRGVITQHWFDNSKVLQVICLNSDIESMMMKAVTGGGAIEPGLANTLISQTQKAVEMQEKQNLPPVLMVEHVLRPMLSRMLRRQLPNLVVMSGEEIPPDCAIIMTSEIGATQ
ncbi:flagellar biosynthesis protein FlhA [Pseudomonas serbica]|jgi:flagellar biosynthesis protein FlhA|uniref:flagellar biosynthesis protein FlhA n=1 Tax=Pseudomonas serbica TaxID=2965074 RepID=UPI00237AEC65|nr:flagellar biosynthesis protein FlhA [Pseudomonas serbica]